MGNTIYQVGEDRYALVSTYTDEPYAVGDKAYIERILRDEAIETAKRNFKGEMPHRWTRVEHKGHSSAINRETIDTETWIAYGGDREVKVGDLEALLGLLQCKDNGEQVDEEIEALTRKAER